MTKEPMACRHQEEEKTLGSRAHMEEKWTKNLDLM